MNPTQEKSPSSLCPAAVAIEKAGNAPKDGERTRAEALALTRKALEEASIVETLSDAYHGKLSLSATVALLRAEGIYEAAMERGDLATALGSLDLQNRISKQGGHFPE